MAKLIPLPSGYPELLEELKSRIRAASYAPPYAQPGNHPALLVYRTGPVLPIRS